METKPQVKHKQLVLIYKWAVVCFVLEELLPEVKEVKHLCSETLFGSYLRAYSPKQDENILKVHEGRTNSLLNTTIPSQEFIGFHLDLLCRSNIKFYFVQILEKKETLTGYGSAKLRHSCYGNTLYVHLVCF